LAALLWAGVLGVIGLQCLEQLPGRSLLLAGLLVSLLLALAALLTRAGLRSHADHASAEARADIPAPTGGAVRPGALALLLAALLCGFCSAGLRASLRLADALDFADEGRSFAVQGVVASLPQRVDGGLRFVFDLDPACAPAGVPRRIALGWYSARIPGPGSAAATVLPPPEIDLLPAQRWAFTVRLHRPHASLNPGGFDAEAWMLEQGVRAVGTVRTGRDSPAPVRLQDWVWAFNPLVDRARANLRGQLAAVLEGRPYGSVIIALVMGDQGGLSEDDWALFNRTGISHLVSISGLHITMIAALVAVCSAALWRRSAVLLRCASLPTVRAVAAIAGGFAYCLLAGWGVPAQRTLLMLAVVAVAQCGRLRLAPSTILAAAAALVCLWDPWAVLAAGFWLSFGAVACIFLASSGRLRPPPGWRNGLREALRLQGAITLGQVPLTLAIFGQVSLVAPLANAVAIPLVSYAVAPLALLGAAALSCGAWAAVVAAPLLQAAAALFGLLAQLLQWLLQPAWASFMVPVPPPLALGVAALGCAWLLAPAGWPLRAAGLCLFAPLFLWPVPRPGPGELWLTALDVGQGMAGSRNAGAGTGV